MSDTGDAFQAAAELASAQMQQAHEQVGEMRALHAKATAIAESIVTTAELQVALEDIRADRDASPEKIMDAAQAFRSQQAKLDALIHKTISDEMDRIRKEKS